MDNWTSSFMGEFQESDKNELHTLWKQTLPNNIVIQSVRDSLENFIAHRMFKIPYVEYVIIAKKEDSREIWTIINKLTRKVRKKIYDIEYTILELFKELYFDFHVVCRNNRDINKFFTFKDKLIFKRP